MKKPGKSLTRGRKTSSKRAYKPYIRSGPHPQGIRFDAEERELIRKLQRLVRPRLSVSEITRRAVRYTLPLILNRKVAFHELYTPATPASNPK